MIAEDIINEIRARADIVAVIGQHVQLKKAGRNWKGLCPFHGEKTPSFNVSPDKGFFHCFGCQKHGDVFTFVMELEGKSFVEAAEHLGARFGIQVPKIDEPPEVRRARGERVAMLDINKHAAAFFREILADPKRGEPGRHYLESRGVGDATSDKFQLGYAPADWGALGDYLKAKGADLSLATRLGLIRPRERAGGYYDVYRERLVCPIIVPGGEIVGFSARVVGKPQPRPDGSEPPKYINSPESTVYKKSRLLFGLAQAREGMQQNGRAVLVEGNFDVITLHQAEFTEVVAPLGTALTVEQVLTLKRLTDKVVLVYDGDRAGYKATMHALQICVEAEVEALVARRPGNSMSGGGGTLADGVDPDSLVASGGSALLKAAITNAIGGIEYFCFEVWGKARANVDARTRALEDAARLAARIANPLKRDLFVDTFAKAMDVQPGLVRQAVERASRGGTGGPVQGERHGYRQPDRGGERGGDPSQPRNPAGPARTVAPPSDEVEVIQVLVDHPSLIGSPEADKAFWLLTDETLRAMYSAARDGQSVLELAPVLLPPSIAKTVLSGKYSDNKDPRAALAAMASNLEMRKRMLEQVELQKKLVAAKRGTSDPDIVRLEAQLGVARRLGNLELVEQLEGEISSKRKKAE